MKKIIRKILLKIDFKIYLLTWFVSRHIAYFLLKFTKDSNKRDKLVSNIIYEPFSSKYQAPYISIIDMICDIKTKD